jgi:NAD(P)-dependent dehydrogenase (short-subunit alcohol dehydrogenase family)
MQFDFLEEIMEKNLEGKVAIVTGGTSGIGRASAIALAREGAKVVVSGRREKEGQETVQLIKKAGGTALFVKADITNEADVSMLVKKCVETYGRLDIAFNNAGVFGHTPIVDVTIEEYKRIFDANVEGVVLSMKHEVPAMLKNGGGAIINMASVVGLVGVAEASLYDASKHAVIGLTKSAALEFAKKNIRVNAVAPAGIETEMLEGYVVDYNSEGAKQFKALHPMGRFGKPEEIASVVVFLASSGASYVTGQTIAIDGGFIAA